MIHIDISLDSCRCLRSLSLKGHSQQGRRGDNIVCSAVTAVARTAGRLIEGSGDISSEGSARVEGFLELFIRSVPEGKQAWLQGVSDFVLCAFADLSREYPAEIHLQVRTVQTEDTEKIRRQNYGS